MKTFALFETRFVSFFALIALFGLASCSKTTNPVTTPNTTGAKQLTLGSQFVYNYSLLDSTFKPESINTTSTYTVTQTGANLRGKTNVSTLRYIRTASTLGIDPDSSVILIAIEANGDISYLDTNAISGWITLPIASKTSTTIAPTDTTSDGNGVVSSGTVHYLGTSTMTVGSNQIAVVSCQVLLQAATYTLSTLERSQSDSQTILFAPDLGFMISNVDDMTFTGSIGDLNKGGSQEVATSYTIK